MICCCVFLVIIIIDHILIGVVFDIWIISWPSFAKDAAGAFRGELGTLLQVGESGRCVAVPLICQG